MEALAQGLAAGKTQAIAYAEAGYTGKSVTAAFKACNNPNVLVRKAEIIRERHEIERRSTEKAIVDASIDKGYIVSRLKYLADRGIRGTVPVFDAKGDQSGWRPTGADTNSAVRSLEILARMGGYMVDKVELGMPGDFARLNDDELMAQLIQVGESIGIDGSQIQKAIEGKVA